MIAAAYDDLEQSVIGAVLLRADTLALLPELATDHFVTPIARATWEAIRNLESANRPIDVTTIGDELCRVRLSRATEHEGGGNASAGETLIWDFLQGCALRTPTTDNAIEYARRLKDHALHRRIVDTLGEVLQEARTGDMTGADLLTLALGGLAVLDAEQPEGALTVQEVLKRRMAQIDEIQRQRALGSTSITGYFTGVGRLDDITGGWQPGVVSIVAARPGMGKSSFGLATADECSARGLGVHLFSLEDSNEAYADRVMARTSNVPAETIRNANMNRGQMENLHRALTTLKGQTKWLIDSRSDITAEEIVRSVRRHKRDNDTKVVIVDYVQLVSKPRHMQRATTHEHLTDAITTLANAAKHDGIAYVVMSQLNREIEKRADRRPQLADMRESGSLEERAKCVVGMYRGHAYGGEAKRGVDFPMDGSPPTLEQWRDQVQLIVLKNSNGRTGTVHATWNGPTTRIE